MSQRKDSLSRAQLIGGMIATGALVSCGGGVNIADGVSRGSPMLGNNMRGTSTKPVGVDEIFSDPVFKDLDKAALVKAFDPSPQIKALNKGYFAQVGQIPQTGNVIRQIPSAGIVIKKPGKYRLGGNIVWRPNDVQCSAITIKSSDVTLDLAGFTLRAVVSDKSQMIAGIVVDGPAVNVTITNGTLANLPQYGILATSVYGLKISSITVTGVCMKNLATRLLTPSGIEVDDSVNVAISNCSVEGLNVTTDSCAGIFLQKTIQATVTNCRAVGLTNHDGAIIAFSAISCSDVTTAGCTAKTLRSHFNGNTLASGHTVLGFCPIFCWNLSYVDCSSSGLIGCCDDCHGMSVFLDGQVTVTGFRADDVVDGVSQSHSGAKATGLEVYGVNVTIVNSTVSNIKAINPQDRQSTGFSAWGLNIQFEGCKATDVTTQGNLVKDAHAEGFGWAPDPRQPLVSTGAVAVTYTDCTAVRCDVGFDTWYHVDSKWIRPVYKNCKTGILIEPGAKRTLSCDPCSECQPQMDVPITNIESGNTVNGKPIA
jgi:hypothetical protein